MTQSSALAEEYNDDIASKLASCLATKALVTAKPLATLWAGYGTVLEVDVQEEEEREEGGHHRQHQNQQRQQQQRQQQQQQQQQGQQDEEGKEAQQASSSSEPGSQAPPCQPRQRQQRMVAKVVSPPPGSGLAHERKLKSYEVEQYFYRHLAAPGLIERCPMPRPVFVGEMPADDKGCSTSDRAGTTTAVTTSSGGAGGNSASVGSEESGSGGAGGRRAGGSSSSLVLVMSDLREEYPVAMGRYGSMDLQYAKAGLTWLAGFHAWFWEDVPTEGVWEQGSFWHLDTRLEELEKMAPEWAGLKAAAAEVDAALRPEGQRFRTLVHGDFKSFNLLWRSNDQNRLNEQDRVNHQSGLNDSSAQQQQQQQPAAAAAGAEAGGGALDSSGARLQCVASTKAGASARPLCAAYDFQYTGGGYGMRDVAYFMTSAVRADVLQSHERELLMHYHRTLTGLLTERQAAEYTLEVAIEHFDLAVTDFVRFQAGRGWWGATDWAAAKARKVLAERFQR